MEDFFRFDTETNAIDFLEKAIFFIKESETNPKNYKWVAISLFGALYGFAVCASRGTNNNSVCYKNKTGEERLKSFDAIIKLCKNNRHMKMTSSSKHLVLTQEQGIAINILKDEIRNNFEHFLPKGWSIQIKIFHEVIPKILEVIHFLALETGNYVLLDPIKKEYVRNLFSRTVI
jgi:hypothetical protein